MEESGEDNKIAKVSFCEGNWKVREITKERNYTPEPPELPTMLEVLLPVVASEVLLDPPAVTEIVELLLEETLTDVMLEDDTMETVLVLEGVVVLLLIEIELIPVVVILAEAELGCVITLAEVVDVVV